jgi:hypothetical protein
MTGKKAKEIQKGNLEFIEGEFVDIKQSTVHAVEGGHIDLQQVAALSIDGERVEVTQGASGVLRGHEVSLNQSISGVSAADNLSVNFSFTPVSFSREQTVVNRSAVGLMAAREIHSENTSAFLVLSGKLGGNVTTLLDWRSALAFGAVLGGVWGFFSLLLKRK